MLAGGAMMAWYPDPYRFDVKGTIINKSLNMKYILSGLRAPVLWSALACGTFAGVECIVEQLRDETKESTFFNSSAAGAATGIVLGSITKRVDIMATSALGLGMLMGLLEYNGQKMQQDAEGNAIRIGGAILAKDSATVNDLKQKYPEFKDL
jgi:hypothetical protein